MKRAMMLLFLLMCGRAFAQQEGTPVKSLSGSGVPGPNTAHVVGTEYIDFSATPNILYVCSSVTYAAGSQTCTWTSVSGATNTPNGSGPIFNVKGYGAKGDTQTSNNGVTNGTTTVTCSDCGFTTTAIESGKSIYVHTSIGASEQFNTATTIITVNSGSSVTVSNAASGSISGATIVWGHLDDTPVSTAVTAFLAQIRGVNQVGSLGVFTSAPTLYFPAGNYLFCSSLAGSLITISGAGNKSGFSIIGDGPNQSILTAGSGTSCPTTNNNASSLLQISSSNGIVRGLTFDGANNVPTALSLGPVDGSGSSTHWYDVIVQRWEPAQSGASGFLSQGQTFADRLTVIGSGRGFVCSSCNGELYKSTFTNNGNQPNLVISGVTGLQNGSGFRVVNSLIDECGSNATGCTQVINSHDVWFQGLAAFGTSSGRCLDVDGTSFVHWSGGICGSFGNDTNNSGAKVETGGTLQSSDVRYVSTGTGNCIINNGAFQDNGGNTCESQFTIASGTSTGTTAVLTLNSLGAAVNTNCSVNDALLVQGAGIAGYNGYFPAPAITAVTATTLTYTTLGSNLGALGTGGVAFCRNLQTYSGNLPRALLNNPVPNTCYITGTFAATVTGAPMCNFRAQSATNITRITASSTTVTACTVAPVVTISDGTLSQTLTLTTGQSQWDSAVDASTGVGTTKFKPNGTIQVTNTAGTCTTPPTNFSVSYNISPILSN